MFARDPSGTRPGATGTAAAGRPVGESLCTVIANEPVNAEYRHLVLAAPPVAMTVQAGQFFHLLCPAPADAEPFLRRPMSVYRIERAAGRLAFLYKAVGAGTRGMAGLAAGDAFNILGPLGRGFVVDPACRGGIVVLGRGVGLATLAPLAGLAAERSVPATAILSARRGDLLMSDDVFRAGGADVIAVTDEDGSSAVDNVAAILERLVAEGRADAFYTCGSDRLLQLLKRLGAKHGIPGQVALEQQMACGLGMCFCCVRRFAVDGREIDRRVCCEGPVFDIAEALSW